MADRSGHPGTALRTAADYSWRILIVGAAVFGVLFVLNRLLTLVIAFTLALLVTALLSPVHGFLRRHQPAWAATLSTLILALAFIALIITVVATKAVSQGPQLVHEVERLIPKVRNWLVHGPVHMNPSTIDGLSNSLSKQVREHGSQIASTAVSTGKTVAEIITGVLLMIFSTIFLLHDGEKIWGFLVIPFPAEAKQKVDAAGRAAWAALVNYMRGAVVVAIYHGVVIALALLLIGVPLVAPLALLVALGSFIPLIGAVVTGIVAVGVAGVSHGLVAAIIVAVVLIVNNEVEGHVLQPFVVGRYVRVHPLAVVLALTAGALLLGVFGALVAVPLTACLSSIVRSLRHGDTDGDTVGPPPVDQLVEGDGRAPPAAADPAGPT